MTAFLSDHSPSASPRSALPYTRVSLLEADGSCLSSQTARFARFLHGVGVSMPVFCVRVCMPRKIIDAVICLRERREFETFAMESP